VKSISRRFGPFRFSLVYLPSASELDALAAGRRSFEVIRINQTSAD
jgi:hypothetical protein